MKEVDKRLLDELKRSLRIWLNKAGREGWSYAEKWEIIPDMIEKDTKLADAIDDFCDEHIRDEVDMAEFGN